MALLGLTPGAPLSDAQPATRSTAFRGLSTVNDPAFISAMDALVGSAEPSRWDAARVLAGMDPHGLDLLRDHFGSGDAELRRVLAKALASSASGTMPELVRSALESADGLVRLDGAAAAAAALDNDESPWQDVAASLIAPYPADPYVVIGAPVYFIRQGKDESVQALIDGLEISGDVRAAEILLNSGKDELRKGAVAWARQNGYTIEESPGSSGVEWGKD